MCAQLLLIYTGGYPYNIIGLWKKSWKFGLHGRREDRQIKTAQGLSAVFFETKSGGVSAAPQTATRRVQNISQGGVASCRK